MKRVLLIATGGTIASVKTAHGLTPRLSPEVLRGSVPQIEEICEVDSIQLFNLDSTNMQPEHWLRIAETVEKNYEKYDGFVITHGTDTTVSYTHLDVYKRQSSYKTCGQKGFRRESDPELF